MKFMKINEHLIYFREIGIRVLFLLPLAQLLLNALVGGLQIPEQFLSCGIQGRCILVAFQIAQDLHDSVDCLVQFALTCF